MLQVISDTSNNTGQFILKGLKLFDKSCVWSSFRNLDYRIGSAEGA